MATNWIPYDGSDEQIAEIQQSNGFVIRREGRLDSPILKSGHDGLYNGAERFYLSDEITHYLICNPHPLADMISRQAYTGQPVWIKVKHYAEHPVVMSTKPNWNIPNAEYSFTPFDSNSPEFDGIKNGAAMPNPNPFKYVEK